MILRKKFHQYLFPTFITLASLSLNEFADSMLVARLLGSDGMAVVNLGAPVMMIMAVLYTLFGCGGATVYATCLGRRDAKGAGEGFTCSMIMAVIAGVGMLALCALFFLPLTSVFCKEESLRITFDTYFRVLILSSPLLVILLTFVQFLPSAGMPAFSTAVNVIANVVNIIMDYVYIHFFGMDVEGAAWATFTGYVCATVVIIFILVIKRPKLIISKEISSSFTKLGAVIRQGSADVMTQIGFAFQLLVCNALASSYGALDGVVSYSLCIQALSVSSIFMGALIGAYTPLIALLHGQRDYRGENGLLKIALKYAAVLAAVCAAVFAVFAPQSAALYNITEGAQMQMAIRALRVFSLCVLIRSCVIVYFRYLRVTGMTGYATLIGALDGFLSLVPVIVVSTLFIGLDGIWWGYVINALIVVIFVFFGNMRIRRRSGGALFGPLLFEADIKNEVMMDVTITGSNDDIAGTGKKLQDICEENGMDKRDAMHAALAVEEMAVYISENMGDGALMDILVRKTEDNIEIDFRSLGNIIDPNGKFDEDMDANIKLLKGLSKSISTENNMGMNMTRITF